MAGGTLLLGTLSCLLLFTVHAQNITQEFLNAHNAERSSIPVPAMKWNATVAAYAQNYAATRINNCTLVHSKGPYGENLFWGSGKQWTATEAVQAWISEKQYYNYTTNTCAPGKVCGHYTQVVWNTSVNLGCARVVCNTSVTTIFITCNYSPPGNYVGKRPY